MVAHTPGILHPNLCMCYPAAAHPYSESYNSPLDQKRNLAYLPPSVTSNADSTLVKVSFRVLGLGFVFRQGNVIL